jgi:hypothetical protein
MTAYELADWVEDENVVDIMFTPQEHYRHLVSTMLRYQADYIKHLEEGLDCSIKLNKAQADRAQGN